MAHRILVRVGPPFIQVLVQKSVTAITNLAGRPSRSMLRKLRPIRKGNGRGIQPAGRDHARIPTRQKVSGRNATAMGARKMHVAPWCAQPQYPIPQRACALLGIDRPV